MVQSMKTEVASRGPVLVVLAAGMGSRYGGLKQLEGVGPNGETILEYSVYDALRSGFGKVVFVIRRDMEKSFTSELASRFPEGLRYEVAFQGVEDMPPGVEVPEGRQKPWGTAHAVWCAREHVDAPFAVINADDFYGRSAFAALGTKLREYATAGDEQYCLVGYSLGATLSAAGTVSRGVCSVDMQGYLKAIEEHTKIAREGAGIVERGAGQPEELPGDAVVSMNCWGFSLQFMQRIEQELLNFFGQPQSEWGARECYLPNAVMRGLALGVGCKVLRGGEGWCGVTYPADKEPVVRHIAHLVARGDYESPLWGK